MINNGNYLAIWPNAYVFVAVVEVVIVHRNTAAFEVNNPSVCAHYIPSSRVPHALPDSWIQDLPLV